jgi:hypothetical protein
MRATSASPGVPALAANGTARRPALLVPAQRTFINALARRANSSASNQGPSRR